MKMDKPGDDEHQQLEYQQRLKAAIHYSVGSICSELAKEHGVQISRQFIATVAEATFKQTQRYATDLEIFANHAKRSVIKPEDVKILVRKSPTLLNHLEQMSENQKVKHEVGKQKRKEKKAKQPSSKRIKPENFSEKSNDV